MRFRGNKTAAAAALSRRAFVIGLPLAAAACQTSGATDGAGLTAQPAIDPGYVSMYAAMAEERFPIPAIDIAEFDRRYLRKEVAYSAGERVGTIVIDTSGPFLYLVRENGRALRYGIGVGRDGFAWAGRAQILMKRQWPTWTPPTEMVARQPELEPYRNGMEPGLENPLGARALYLFEGGRDTLYRIHGTNDPRSIGKSVSSGCIRLLNQDVIDLFHRVPVGTEVVVKHDGPAIAV